MCHESHFSIWMWIFRTHFLPYCSRNVMCVHSQRLDYVLFAWYAKLNCMCRVSISTLHSASDLAVTNVSFFGWEVQWTWVQRLWCPAEHKFSVPVSFFLSTLLRAASDYWWSLWQGQFRTLSNMSKDYIPVPSRIQTRPSNHFPAWCCWYHIASVLCSSPARYLVVSTGAQTVLFL